MSKRKTIHIIDDDDIFQFTINKYFEKLEIDVDLVFSKNGEEAISMIKGLIENGRELPQTMLLDINMPIMNGWEFLEEFEKLKKGIPTLPIIYMVSSSINEMDIERAEKDENIKEYIVKPLQPDKLKEIAYG